MTGSAQTKGTGRTNALRLALAITGVAACQCAMAQLTDVTPLDLAGAAARSEQPARLEISSATVPRMDTVEGLSSSRRIDMTLLAPSNSSAVGLVVGMRGFSQPVTVTGAGLAPAVQPTVDVGVHFRQPLDNYRVDVTAYRRVTTQQPDAYTLAQQNPVAYGARVELNLSPAKSSTFSDRGFLGMQLDNGAKISLRRKFGGPMVYYRNTF